MKSNNPLRRRITVLILVVSVITLVGYYWWNDAISAYDPTDTQPVVFIVSKGESVRDIASRLAGEKLIRGPLGFYLLVKSLGIERNIQAGDFRLNRSMDATHIAKELTIGMLDVWVTILEGWRNEEIAIELAKNLNIPEQEFLRVADEGYMFPDTYLIPQDATASAIAEIFRKNFNKKVDSKMREEAQKEGLTLNDVIILASIVEREGKTDNDRPVIAGILLNRLENGWPLQADATIQYALGYQPDKKTWWKKDLIEEDTSIDSPYNTYAHTGLPPGPITNSGLASIRAVLYSQRTDNMYYLHDNKGIVHYAKTLEEHQQNIETNLNQ